MMLNTLRCPHCLSEHLENYSFYETKNNGTRKLYRCRECQQVFSETKGTFLEGLKKPISLIINVLKSRSEGTGFNAVCRIFEISKNTLLDWEQRFAGLQGPLLLYALLHTFLSQLIEGDEVYTKIEKNRPQEESEGWTVVLMDRASRFIWALQCGKKDRDLFLSARAFCKIPLSILVKRSFTWFSCLKNMFNPGFSNFYVDKAKIISLRTHFGRTSPKPRFLT